MALLPHIAMHFRILDSRRLLLQGHLKCSHWLNNRRLRQWLFFAVSLAALAPVAAPVHAHSQGMFATKEQAEKRAAELKCQGVFVMESLWMPCANERALHNALQKQ